MTSNLLNKRIPTILGIGFVILGIALTTIATNNQTNLNSKASNSEEPRNVKITNLSDKSFTITYQTDAAVTGSVNYGRDKNLGNIELEELDKEKGNFSPKSIHSITMKKLSPKTKYNFVIISGQNTFLNNGVPFEILTGPNISSSSAEQHAIKGNVLLPNGDPPDEALVYLHAQNSQLLSSVTAKNGTYDFSLKNLRSEDIASYLEIGSDTVLELTAISKNSLKSTVLTSLSKKGYVPTITLSNNYNFTDQPTPVASKSGDINSSGFPTIAPKQTNLKPQILSPKENQSFDSQKPRFRGISLPNEQVEITIHSDEQITTSVIADSNGNWTYQHPNNLSPGEHTITIKTRNASGILTTLTESFVVLASETQVSKPATPTPTSVPTSTPIPTATLTPLPPSFLSPTLAPMESKGGLAPTGSFPAGITIGGIITAAIGIGLFLLTRSPL